MGTVNLDRLLVAVADDGRDAGIKVQSTLEPLGGSGTKVKPAVYAGGRFQVGRRWWGDDEGRRVVDTITIDNEPSQANRLEAALEAGCSELGLPELTLDLSALEPLPPHVPRRLSSFRFPHRNADAYLRDAELDGIPFPKTDIGRAIFSATADSADALLEWFPQALLFGFWQSHLGKKGSQAKLARSWSSEIIGIEPATEADDPIRLEAVKGDPYALVRDGNEVVFDENEVSGWQIADGKSKGRKRLSEIGHGQALASGDERALAGVSFSTIAQQATVSFAALRRVRTLNGSAEARALLVALGLVAHTRAFGHGFHLRSGCDLRPTAVEFTWIGADGDERIDTITSEQADALLAEAAEAAASVGLPVGSAWPEPITLVPNAPLAKVIRNTYPEPEER